MPEIQITMKDRGIEVRRKIAAAVTEIVSKEAGVDPDWITIHFYATDEEHAARNGKLLADLKQQNGNNDAQTANKRVEK